MTIDLDDEPCRQRLHDRDGFGVRFGWFLNHLQGYPEPFRLESWVHPQNDGHRPLIELEPTDHPLSLEERHGITLDRILDIYAEYGHDMRDALSAQWA